MDFLDKLFANKFLIVGISSWVIAQVLKLITHAVIYKKVDINRLFGDGGMPSGHSATVTSVATMAGLCFGVGSFEFALSAILAIIVCHDAKGVRLETGKQAMLLNEMVETVNILTKKDLPKVKLKEFVGHTPVQVGAGVVIGILNATVMYFLVW